MIAAGPAAIAARVVGLALLLAPPARGAERMPVLPEELAITRSIDVQDEDEFQTSLSARHLRLPHERSTTVRADLEYGVALLYPWREWFLTFEGAGETAAGETAYMRSPSSSGSPASTSSCWLPSPSASPARPPTTA